MRDLLKTNGNLRGNKIVLQIINDLQTELMPLLENTESRNADIQSVLRQLQTIELIMRTQYSKYRLGQEPVFFSIDLITGTCSYNSDNINKNNLMLKIKLMEIHCAADYIKQINHCDIFVWEAALRAHLEERTSIYESNYRLLDKAHCWLWVTAYGKVLRNVSGRPQYLVGVLRECNPCN